MLGAAETDPISTGNEKRLLKKKKRRKRKFPHGLMYPSKMLNNQMARIW